MTATETPTPERVQQTMQDYLRVATETGELAGTHVEFSRDGVTWADVLVGGEHPAVARATVHRKGHVIATVVTVIWDEAVPVEEGWRGLWIAKPHVLFGAFVLRQALRRAFADVLSDRREPDDHQTGAPPTPAEQQPVVHSEEIDWHALIAATTTADEVAEVRDRARAARAVTIELRTAINRRMRDFEQTKPEAAAPTSKTRKRSPKKPSAPKPAAPKSRAPKPTAVAEAFRAAEARKAGAGS